MIQTRSVEQRLLPRNKTDMDVTMVYKDLPVNNCRTQNIGFGGSFVSTPDAALPINAPVRLILRNKAGNPVLSVNGDVVFSSDKGVGVEFRDLQTEAYGPLLKLVYSWPQGSSSAPNPVKAVKAFGR